jgi:hypothetical protein
VTKFSVSSKGINNHTSLTNLFVSFFAENYTVGFELDKKSDTWKEDMEERERKTMKNLFYKIKRAVNILLLYSDSFPLPPEDPGKYKEILRRVAVAAEERLRASHESLKEKDISFYVLINELSTSKVDELKLSLPDNTPPEWRKLFK